MSERETSGESVQENSARENPPESALSATRRERQEFAAEIPAGARTMRNLRDRRRVIE